jgi:hypothetical protein
MLSDELKEWAISLRNQADRLDPELAGLVGRPGTEAQVEALRDRQRILRDRARAADAGKFLLRPAEELGDAVFLTADKRAVALRRKALDEDRTTDHV